MSRLLDQVDDYLRLRRERAPSRSARAQAFDRAKYETEYSRELDRAEELHARARGVVLRPLTREERREKNRLLWRTHRKTMRSFMETPAPGKFFWRIVDYESLPIERLKPYFDPRAIEAAIAVAIAMGLRDLGGVQIEQDIGGYDERPLSRRQRAAASRRAPPPDDNRGRTPFHVAYDRRADIGGLTRS